MKYSPQTYAQALAGALADHSTPEKQKAALANFSKLAIRNGDTAVIPKALALTERLLAKMGKGDVVVIESARPLKDSERTKLVKSFDHSNVHPGRLEERIVPSLVAGVRITINDERELDASLIARLRKLFT